MRTEDQSVCRRVRLTVRLGLPMLEQLETVRPISRAIWRRRTGEMSRPAWNGTVVVRPAPLRNCLCEPRCRTSTKPKRLRIATTSEGLRTGTLPTTQATATFCTPTNSDSSTGSPSSRSIDITSRRLAFSSSSVAPWECAPGKPGTKPTKRPVSGSRSITAEYVFTSSSDGANTRLSDAPAGGANGRPNVKGNRRADEMLAEDQAACRRVRLTGRLGHYACDGQRRAPSGTGKLCHLTHNGIRHQRGRKR